MKRPPPDRPADLLALYRFAQTLEPDPFAAEAFGWLKREVDFERAAAVTAPNVPSWIEAHFYNVPDPRGLMNSQARVRHLDIFTPRTIARPFIVQRQDTEDAEIRGKRFAPLREHLIKYWARYALCVALPRTGEATLLFVVLIRGWTGDARFSDGEVARFQALAPHFGEAFTINRHLRFRPEPSRLLHPRRPGAEDLPAALVDGEGRLLQTTPTFVDAFWTKRERADGYLPKPVISAIERGRPYPLPGGKLTVYGHAEPTGGWMIRLRSSGPLDRLSIREREIAGLFARGATSKAIASELGVAPATARNHIQKIYAKLGVSDRDELTAVLARP